MSIETPARACGIDFGTSNSTVGWLRPGQPTLLALENGKPTLPSVVFFNAEENTVSVGQAGLKTGTLVKIVGDGAPQPAAAVAAGQAKAK